MIVTAKMLEGTGIVATKVEPYVDTEGDDAMRVWLIIADDADEMHLPHEKIRGLKDQLNPLMSAEFPGKFIYFFIAKEKDIPK